MQADVAGLREQRHQRAQRAARRGDDQVVVVDEEVDLGSLPPRAGPQLLGRDVGPGQPGAQELGDALDGRGGLVLGGEVLPRWLSGSSPSRARR